MLLGWYTLYGKKFGFHILDVTLVCSNKPTVTNIMEADACIH